MKTYLITQNKGDNLETSLKFEELKEAKKTEDLVENLHTLLVISKKENDYQLSLDILKYLSETMRYLRLHDKAVDFLDKEINSDYFNRKDDILDVIDELVRTLLKTEDFIKLKSVLFMRERFLTSKHQKVMQKFYLAVCNEGLKEYKEAIDNLLSIKDDISSSNLVSKYLKLSMLYLKQKESQKAKDYFFKAVKFDPKKSNPIFYLAESDILYDEGDFLNALALYQEYFIKSRNKRRYLDRFILINIKLNHLDEAWKFYQEYLPVVKGLVSRNYRLVFYEAGLLLAKELKNDFEIDKLTYLIQELEPTKPVLNQFDNVYRLLTIAFKQIRYLKDRDIIYDLIKAIDSLYKFQKLLLIRKIDEDISFLHYSKGLLLEKNPKITEYSNTIIETIINTNPVSDLYTFDDLINYPKEMYKTADTSYVFVNGIKRENEFDYFIVFSKDLDDFDFQQKLILIATEILKKQLIDFDVYNYQNSLYMNYRALFNKENLGFIKIDKGIIHLLNDHAKSILAIDSDYIVFEEFQNRLVEKKFVDDFLYTDSMTLAIKSENTVKRVKFSVVTDEYTIYATVKEETLKEEKKNLNEFLDVGNENQLLKDLKQTSSKNIILFNITNYLEFFKDYNYQIYKDKLNELLNNLKSLAKNHFDNIYLESFNALYLTLNTIDKRVVNRIIENVYKLENDFEIRTSVINVNNSLNYDGLIKLRYLNSLTTDDTKYIFDNKNFRYNLELAKTILLNINNLIENKFVPLEYQGVGKWSENEIRFLKVNVSSKAMLGEIESQKRVLRANNLEEKWDLFIVNQFIKDIKKANFIGGFIIDISNSSISDIKTIKKIIKKLASYENPLYNYQFRIDFSKFDNLKEILLSLAYIKENKIGLIGYNFIKNFSIDNLEMFDYFDYLDFDFSDLNHKNIDVFRKITGEKNIKYILNHKHNTLKRSELEKSNITYVYGDKYGKYESVTALQEK